ncbi:murein hydrolase effector protein LrgB [Vibrio sp. 10N.261.46.E8]|nr:murein hydrolase effector protein LrgB [Vibrio sp. 10N.261.45.E1]PMJ36804.1 murein hydrolase effector protein LrgB [Vibrio sp. 10N.286.45.B6]PML82904.1 murein hydrolase effector protein LrgB [Vibrio sp. 10N.261.49.E11]PMM65712.1 murein hydrolase effector protein LrgB [Vibrio sp. 10N.261.46.F12]PMM78992.1 murein hydrolase effector protein LrgB [Vibrio sp. 10N.261.46.E8]PMN27832.1 murein hydrolase effector protein LrgB [Vibrio sp. 10N.261.45.E2]PMN57511.1 murein hydrolase effector protein Lr
MHSFLPISCFVFTVLGYYSTKSLYGRFNKVWLIPLVSVPVLIVTVLLLLNISYQDYIQESHWLVWMLGPATVAFAIPVYENRKLLKNHWLSISIGVVMAVMTALFSTILLSKGLHLSELLQKSLAVRSITTPFAVVASKAIGGEPELTSIFVVMTGIVGIVVGETMLNLFRIRSRHGKGAGLGASAHGSGTAIAYGIHSKAGTIASLIMLFSGVVTVLIAPLIGLVV